MGVPGTGGARIGSGEKPQEAVIAQLRGKVVRGGQNTVKAVLRRPEPVPEPADLSPAEAELWREMAPEAHAAGTLVPRTVGQFRDLIEAILVKRQMLREIEAEGYQVDVVQLQMDEAGGGVQSVQKKAHGLWTHYRGMLQRVETMRAKFSLCPFGKPIIAAEPPEDEWSGFDPQ